MKRFMWMTFMMTTLAPPAIAVPTSCDVVTGASCLWDEGCDCDHDGYVRDHKKSKKYCHLKKCPLDANDNDPAVFGKKSKYNADGDGWTEDYDCDDNDPCVDNSCGNVCGPEAVDNDGDGIPAIDDCDDDDPCINASCSDVCGPETVDNDGDGIPATDDCDDDDPCINATCSDVCGPDVVDKDGDGIPATDDCDDDDPCINASCSDVCGPDVVDKDGDGIPATDDCDDNDPCIGVGCADICEPETVDADADGYSKDEDCDDNNAFIKPDSPFACCSCDVLDNPAKFAQFDCQNNPCPFGSPPPPNEPPEQDVVSDPGDAGMGSEAGPELPAGPDASSPAGVFGDEAGASPETGASRSRPPAPYGGDPILIGAGTLEQRGPGCGVSATGPEHLPFLLMFLGGLLLLVSIFRRKGSGKLTHRFLLLMFLVGTPMLEGCALVQPWQRECLAKTAMVFGQDGLEVQLEQHLFQYREGAVGGFGGSAGGCGCN